MSDQVIFQEGDVVILDAGMMAREDGSFVMRGQQLTLTAEEADRSDASLIFKFPSEDEIIESDDDDEDEDDEGEEDDSSDDASFEALRDRLHSMSAPDAKKLLSDESWDLEGLKVALKAEEEGKNRDSVLTLIEGRIEDLEAEEEDGSPS